MSYQQLALDFEAPTPPAARFTKKDRAAWAAADRAHNEAYWARARAEAIAYWRVGMVTSLPLICDIADVGRRYTQMLPGVLEAIEGDTASVRIYAAPEYGYRLENYHLHLALAINVPLVDLCQHHWNHDLERIVEEGLLATGDADLAAAVREREMGLEAA